MEKVYETVEMRSCGDEMAQGFGRMREKGMMMMKIWEVE